jgi:hypothetical protein
MWRLKVLLLLHPSILPQPPLDHCGARACVCACPPAPTARSRAAVDWTALRFVVCELLFGGGIVNSHDRRVIRALGDVLLNPGLLATPADPEIDFPLCNGTALGWLALDGGPLSRRGGAGGYHTGGGGRRYAVPGEGAAGSFQALVRYVQTALPADDTPAVRGLGGREGGRGVCMCWGLDFDVSHSSVWRPRGEQPGLL